MTLLDDLFFNFVLADMGPGLLQTPLCFLFEGTQYLALRFELLAHRLQTELFSNSHVY